MKTEKDKMITKEILNLLEETFEKVTGFYLDKKTSIFETIDSLTSEEASRRLHEVDESVAGHINHVIFYIIVLQEYLKGKRSGKTDWNESWKKVVVTEQEWETLKASLHREYQNLCQFIRNIEEWNNDDYFNSVISILAHCAYHLGSIRQLIELKAEQN